MNPPIKTFSKAPCGLLAATGALLFALWGASEIRDRGTPSEFRNLMNEIANAEEELTGKSLGDYNLNVDGKEVQVRFDLAPDWKISYLPLRKFQFEIKGTNRYARVVMSPYFPDTRVFAGKQEITKSNPDYFSLRQDARRAGKRVMEKVLETQRKTRTDNITRANNALRY